MTTTIIDDREIDDPQLPRVTARSFGYILRDEETGAWLAEVRPEAVVWARNKGKALHLSIEDAAAVARWLPGRVDPYYDDPTVDAEVRARLTEAELRAYATMKAGLRTCVICQHTKKRGDPHTAACGVLDAYSAIPCKCRCVYA